MAEDIRVYLTEKYDANSIAGEPTVRSIGEQAIAEFCAGCERLKPNGGCETVPPNDQARYTA